MKQNTFITVSLLVCIALILEVRAMYMTTGGSMIIMGRHYQSAE